MKIVKNSPEALKNLSVKDMPAWCEGCRSLIEFESWDDLKQRNQQNFEWYCPICSHTNVVTSVEIELNAGVVIK